jgi:hypothetical protein
LRMPVVPSIAGSNKSLAGSWKCSGKGEAV